MNEKTTQETRKINAEQKEVYKHVENTSVKTLLDMYSGVLEKIITRGTINVLDIGGGNGSFSLALKQKIAQTQCLYTHTHTQRVILLDNTKYESWDEREKKEAIEFISGSVYELESLFEKGFFDIIFINRTLHHLVFENWSKTIKGYDFLLAQVYAVLKDDGYLCVTEETAESYVKDCAASFIIYNLTSCKLKPVVKICKSLDGKSAGVGVCFLSDRSWKRIFRKNKFNIESETDGTKRKLRLYYRFLLLLREYRYIKGYVLRKQEYTE
jgi:ubiquinone/menaquinone biosynthesis C-methylase UbiE